MIGLKRGTERDRDNQRQISHAQVHSRNACDSQCGSKMLPESSAVGITVREFPPAVPRGVLQEDTRIRREAATQAQTP